MNFSNSSTTLAALSLHILSLNIPSNTALSSTGHISYMIVRLGPVFRIGSMYIDGAEEKKRWGSNTDVQRLQILMTGKYPWFSFEIGLLAFACLYFAYLRLTTYGIMDDGTCQLQ